MISHSSRGGWWSLRTGWAATTRTKAKRLFSFFPAGVSRQLIVFQARPGSRCASASSDSGSRPARFAAPLRHGKRRLRAEDAAARGDGEHVLEPLPVQSRAEGAVVAVGRVGQDRRPRQPPAGGLPGQTGGQLWLRLKRERIRDLRLSAPLAVRAPLLGQIQ